jgi:hypothetical protein
LTCAQKDSPPFHIIDDKSAAVFKITYKSTNEAVAVQDLLNKYQTDWRVPNKWAKREGKKFVKIQSGGRSQKGLLPADASIFEEYLKEIKQGYFYMVQPVPEFNSNRIKFGYTNLLERRMSAYRAICPNAVMLGSWKCLRHLEKETIHQLTTKCKALTGELFECDDYKELLEATKSYFNYT